MAQYPPEQPRLFHVGIASGGNWLIKSELPAAGMRLRGGEETALNADAGATLSYSASAVLGGKARAAYRTHPPYVGGVGYTYWERDVYVPEGGALEFYTGMGEKAPERSDGVVFAIEAAELAADGKPSAFQRLYAENQVASEWRRNEVSLGAFGGKRARLRFVADCGPNDNATTDHAYWADARVFDPSEESEALTKPVRYQSWLGPNEFVSGFYFREVASKQVDLEFEIEGGEAVEISRISVHASADAIVREYENGIVLANPSLREYSFDLSKLAPGKTYRRLQASPAQDGAVNNGQPVGKSVVLQSKDALFLVKE